MKGIFYIIFLWVFFVISSVAGNSSIYLINPVKKEGKEKSLYCVSGQCIKEPLLVRVVDSCGQGIPSVPVTFSIVRQPEYSKNTHPTDTVVLSDSLGYASVCFCAGDKEGDYIFDASLPTCCQTGSLYFSVHAQKKGWKMHLIIMLLGGLSLFLYGMFLLGQGMEKSAGRRMRIIIEKLTSNRFTATGAGLGITMMTQSSSATVVMLISFVNSGLMRFEQTIGIILGAAIGTTITAQIFAFRLSEYALLFVAAGIAVFFISRQQNVKYIGQGIMWFGILFFGMDLMSQALSPVKNYPPFIEMLMRFEQPLPGILAGLFFTTIVQSSSATIGILMVVASQGMISLQACIPPIIGANIGTVITAFIAAIGTRPEAVKVAVAEMCIKITGALLIVGWISSFADLIHHLSPGGHGEVSRQIANAHTAFNVLLTLIILPFTNTFTTMVNSLISVNHKKKSTYMHYLDENIVSTPSMAISLAKQETITMMRKVENMLKDIWRVFADKDEKILYAIQQQEKCVDNMSEQINQYIIQITRQSIDDPTVQEAFQINYANKEFEQIGDIISTNLLQRAQKWIQQPNDFSIQGKLELEDFHKKTLAYLTDTITVFNDIHLVYKKQIKTDYIKYQQIALEMEKNHFERLHKMIEASVKTSKTHLELMGMFNAIMRHASNVITMVVENKTT